MGTVLVIVQITKDLRFRLEIVQAHICLADKSLYYQLPEFDKHLKSPPFADFAPGNNRIGRQENHELGQGSGLDWLQNIPVKALQHGVELPIIQDIDLQAAVEKFGF
ncbi:MAG: hypothetical protein BWY71_01399 [Planctomycetes bacterium ADurb.Bin412]|nr:MAG: hypothetical protein BWY71_01399 [Planctomycetes bacterium ADurb.Bin412]